jgi:hypothetical protein
MMATLTDIAQVILLLQATFPNYHPEQTTPEALFQTLQDLPSDTLKAAVLASSTQAGRAFPPGVGEIRDAAFKLIARALGIPNEFEAWAEVCKMPKDMKRSQIEVNEKGDMLTNENGAVIITTERLKWSHALVGRTAEMLGWPDFPGEDTGLDRAHFLQAYRAELSRLVERETELPAVREFVERRRQEAGLPVGQEVKRLVERLEK